MMVKVFGGASSNVTRSSLFRGNLEMPGDEQEIADVSVSLPGSLTLAGGIFWLLKTARGLELI